MLLLYWIAGNVATELLEDFAVNFAEHDGGVYLTAVEAREHVECSAAVVAVLAEYGKGNENFVGMEAWVVAVK